MSDLARDFFYAHTEETVEKPYGSLQHTRMICKCDESVTTWMTAVWKLHIFFTSYVRITN
jgi:hypothetical protein